MEVEPADARPASSASGPADTALTDRLAWGGELFGFVGEIPSASGPAACRSRLRRRTEGSKASAPRRAIGEPRSKLSSRSTTSLGGVCFAAPKVDELGSRTVKGEAARARASAGKPLGLAQSASSDADAPLNS
eukprot:scaffold10093_cov104-Isochrysis_galbana.AAC.5